MFLRMDEARRYWGLNGLSGLDTSWRPDADAAVARMPSHLRSSAKALLDRIQAASVALTRSTTLSEVDSSLQIVGDSADRILNIQAAASTGTDQERASAAGLTVIVRRVASEATAEAAAMKPLLGGGSSDRRGGQTLEQATRFYEGALGSARSIESVLTIWSDWQGFTRTSSSPLSEKESASRRVEAAKNAALTRIRGRAPSAPAVTAPASAPALAPAPVWPRPSVDAGGAVFKPGKPGVAPKPVFPRPAGTLASKLKTPAGGALDTQTRDQVLLDLAAGRGTDLTIGPGGGFRPADSGKGVSTGTAVALAVSGVAALALFAVALRRSG